MARKALVCIYLSEGRIFDHRLHHYNTANVVFQPKQMSAPHLRAGYLWMYEQFYSLTNIWRRLPASPRQRAAYLLFNLCYRKFGKLTAAVAGRLGMGGVGRLARRLSYGIG